MKKPVAWMVTWEWKCRRNRWYKGHDFGASKVEITDMMKVILRPDDPNIRNVRGPVPLVERDEA